MRGIVLRYDRLKAHGFIISTEDETLPDMFVCPSFILKEKHCRFLLAGQAVEFDPAGVGTDRPQAHNVRFIPPITIARQVSDTLAHDEPATSAKLKGREVQS